MRQTIWENLILPNEYVMQNVRLFPKLKGPSGYILTGIARRCDWVVTFDYGKKYELRGDLTRQPRTVFLSMRGMFQTLPVFHEEILPRIHTPFVLVSGSEDVTIPRQVDTRWRPFSPAERHLIDRIRSDDRILHWFIENRDQDMPKTSSLPTGLVFPEAEERPTQVPPHRSLSRRERLALCAHRVREGDQWAFRRRVTQLCKAELVSYFTVVEREIPLADYEQLLREHQFVLCVEGRAGIDSPKAWTAILNGAIPIVRSTGVKDAYEQLPVMFVSDWDREQLDPANLEIWRSRLAHHYENLWYRRKVLYRLSIEFWWRKVWRAYTSHLPFFRRMLDQMERRVNRSPRS